MYIYVKHLHSIFPCAIQYQIKYTIVDPSTYTAKEKNIAVKSFLKLTIKK